LSAVALCAVLALSTCVAGAAGKGEKCVKGAEAAGCPLPREQPERGLFEATVNFKSAKLVVVKVHLLDEVGTEVSCDGSATWSLKREP
jgi:hypothetical protein